jgi:ribosomal protein L11 methylase PrmA
VNVKQRAIRQAVLYYFESQYKIMEIKDAERVISKPNMDAEIIEEEWTTVDGSNVFEESLRKLNVTQIDNLFHQKPLIFESFATQQMTPLDMTYENDNNDAFYDGTGSLVWLASIAFCHLVSQDAIPELSDDSHSSRYDDTLRIIELGCGCGLAGISTLLSSPNHANNRKVLFTDNDQEALDLSLRNCQLNSLPASSYQHSLLSWGDQLSSAASETTNDKCELTRWPFDIVLATDVIYDISMIPPLLKSASQVIIPGGYLIVSGAS